MQEVAVETVRASRDGHQYHEAWLARRALGLLLPRNQLCGIAVEGLSVEDQKDANDATIEVADATFYFGKAPSFKNASRVEIAQFKYSIAKAEAKFLCADAKKTLEKFAETEADFISKPDKERITGKIFYTIYTNRPIAREFGEALASLARGTAPSEKQVRNQYDQLLAAISLTADRLKAFATKMSLVGGGDDLQSVEGGNATIIADWSASNDLLARARLGELRQLVRKKAGFAGQHDNIITNIDVLAALKIAHEDDLLPTPQAFAESGPIVEREQSRGFIDGLGSAGLWIVHAAGGIGKTVFVQSLASRLGTQDEIVLFDCFGGGAYRSPVDGRHRPERGLMHLVNELACRGMCDPILPGASDPGEVVRRGIERFSQAISVLRRTRPAARLLVIIDAADNAALEASERGQPSFPQMLLESLSHHPPIDGLLCIATARTERRELAIGKSQCKDFQLNAFSLQESRAFISTRRPDATPAQIDAIHRRAEGNPRVIANLIEPNRSLAGGASKKVDLPDLIRERIQRAVRLSDEKGTKSDEVSAFLCALSVLPPPVPVDDVAVAFGITNSEVESFAADLSPLLERTRHGLIFRDEPTETLVREIYGRKLPLLDGVVTRLANAQNVSIYAARSLPGLLFAMGKTDLLKALAFEARFPPELDSELAKRAIRLNRLRTAVQAAAKARDFSAAVELLVELASLVIVDERGEDYLLESPDLVVGLGDPEALRRLFEVRTSWQGTRHSRLAIAYVADADPAEAHGHAVRAHDWLRWYYTQDEETRRGIEPQPDDFAAIAFYLLATDRIDDVAQYLARWMPAYGYLIACHLFEYCAAAAAFGNLPNFEQNLRKMLRSTKAPPTLVAAAFAAFPDFSPSVAKRFLKRLPTQLAKLKKGSDEFAGNRNAESYRKSLLRCAMRMANLQLATESDLALTFVAPERYGIWALSDSWCNDELISWGLCVAIRCANEARVPDLFDCLPQELWALVEHDTRPASENEQHKLLDTRLKELGQNDAATAKNEKTGKESKLSSDERNQASRRISNGVVPLLTLVRHLTNLIKPASGSQREAAIGAFFDEWASAQSTSTSRGYYGSREQLLFIDTIYRTCVTEVFTALDLFTPDAAKRLAACLQSGSPLAPETVIEFVRRLAVRSKCHVHAGRLAVTAVRLIEREDDVQRRTQLFARLARALLPANRTEASLLFKRGLTELDAIGSGDHEFTSELLHFSATLSGAVLQPALAMRLAKICEINVYDSHKWDWSLTARAFARASGVAYLAQIARWHDRDKVDLDLTLPSALTFLVRDGLMRTEDALPLLRLVDPVQTWVWGWHDLIDAAFAQQGNTVAFVHEILDQFERAYPGRPPSHSLQRIRESLEAKPDIFAAVANRIALLERRQKQPRKVENENRSSPVGLQDLEAVRKGEADRQALVHAALERVDPTDTASVERFADNLGNIGGWPDVKAQAYGKLRDRVPYADRSKHLDAIIGARNLKLFEKNNLLQAIKDHWKADSPTQLASLSGIGLRLVREHAEELLGKSWGFSSDLSKLSDLSGTSLTDLAIVLVESAIARGLNASADTWLSLATILSKQADGDTPRLALERLLDSGAARLADQIGDGPWRSELDPGIDTDEIAAGLLWFGLGSPKAKERWRAAHAVRAMAKFGRWSIIERLFDCLNAGDAGAFQDRTLPFFKFHAQLWFLFAIARIAMEYRKDIARFSFHLEAIALNESFPHVGLREVARQALLRCLSGSRDTATKKLLRQLKKIHKSKFRLLKTRGKKDREFPSERPKESSESGSSFYFDYEFEKYNMSHLAGVFGLPKWRIGDLCQDWIRKWAPTVTSMHDFSGRHRPYSRQGYYRVTDEGYQSYGTFLAWHGLAVVSGQLLLERPITDDSYRDNPWEDWLSGYGITREDGYWIADGTGPYPLIALNDLQNKGLSEGDWDSPTTDRSFLAGLVGLGDKTPVAEQIVVEGTWRSSDKVSCDITTALVDPIKAEIAGLALATSPPLEMWLPTQAPYDEDEPRFRRDALEPCEPWITHVQGDSKIDERDPFGSLSAISFYRPSRSIIARFGLWTKDPWSQLWSDANNQAAFRYHAWGGWQGEGEGERHDSGHALYCERSFLKGTLCGLNRSLIVLVKLQRYHEPKVFGTQRDADGKFTHSFMVAVVDEQLNVTRVEPSPMQNEAVSKLDQYSIHDFQERLNAIKKVLPASSDGRRPVGSRKARGAK